MKLVEYKEQEVREFAKHLDFVGFAKRLGSACYFDLNGHFQGMSFAVTTLLHGNEPSGLFAIYQLLKTDFAPRHKVRFVIASLTAALTEPLFTHRMLPGKKDLNRCFNPSAQGHKQTDLQIALADAINDKISQFKPDAIVDIHNTSGSGPAFGVAVEQSAESLSLVSFFCQRIIITDIHLGAIMEQDFGCPIVTIEAGGSQDNDANDTAFMGLKNILLAKSPLKHQSILEVLLHPRRLEVKDAASITYSLENNTDFDISMRSDIERHNFGITPAGTHLGWVNKPIEQLLKLDNKDQVDAFFSLDGNKLIAKRALRLFMVTTRADIAVSDCLFYVVSADEN
ncbi:hypothetical protein [Glaciecola sp. 1036]|uniref:hypothetical protein n=1 Tax=Alteromonadaceae TaxID=72275 RepID=UPI003D069381